MQGRIEETPGGFRIEASDQFGRAFKIGKQHRDLLALAFQGGTAGKDLLSKMRRYVGARCTLRHRRYECRGRGGVAGPHQHGIVLVHGHPLDLDKLRFQVFEVGLIELKLPGEGTV